MLGVKKWSIELGVAVAGTILIWLWFQYLYPSEPLQARETALVLAVLFVVAKATRHLVSWWRGRTGGQP